MKKENGRWIIFWVVIICFLLGFISGILLNSNDSPMLYFSNESYESVFTLNTDLLNYNSSFIQIDCEWYLVTNYLNMNLSLTWNESEMEIDLVKLCRELEKEVEMEENFIFGNGNVGFGTYSPEEVKENEARDCRYVKEFGDFKFLELKYEERQPISIWENTKTGKIVEMLGYGAPSGVLLVN